LCFCLVQVYALGERIVIHAQRFAQRRRALHVCRRRGDDLFMVSQETHHESRVTIVVLGTENIKSMLGVAQDIVITMPIRLCLNKLDLVAQRLEIHGKKLLIQRVRLHRDLLLVASVVRVRHFIW